MKIQNRSKQIAAILVSGLFLFQTGYAQIIDFSKANIFFPEKKNVQLQKAVQVLQEEVHKRSNLFLPVIDKQSAEDNRLIAVVVEGRMDMLPEAYQAAIRKLPETGKDGYKIVLLDNKTAVIAGHDERGALYGVGRLLRKMELLNGQVLVPDILNISSTPAFPIRGHQMGYRPKTNAYDAWSVAQFDSYIRDLAIFGANSIEIMPPRTDDDFSSVHMKLPAIKMIAEQARICKEYGLDVWMWYPNMGTDYTSPDSIKKELDERETVFGVLPKLDALFVPGGDPGELEPNELFNWLGKVAVVLHKYHPNAKIWVSPQAFKPSKEWYGKFYEHVNRQYEWFGGIVYGPWIRTPLPEVKKLIKPSTAIRLYPDITHSLS
ncbi:MAG: hypothetical protein NTV01_16140, partial [Bacteroidia bacterium]|nr:hypothetical protein [Bacteroidia bacterium]